MQLTRLIDKNRLNFIIYGIGQVFNLVSPIVVAPYIISKCGVDGFGKVGLGFSAALFLILVVDYAFDIKGIKMVSENRNDKVVLQNYLSLVLSTKFILFTLALLLSLAGTFFLPFFAQEKTLYLFSLSIVLAQVFNPVWFLQGIENFKLASLLNIFSKLTYVGLILFFIREKEDYVEVNLFLGISSLLFNIVGLAVIKFSHGFVYCKPDWNRIAAILKDDFSFCVSQLFLSVRQISPLFLVSYFVGYTLAGQYKIIEQVISLFRTFLQVYFKYYYASACYRVMKNFNEGVSYWKGYVFRVFLLSIGALLVLLLGVNHFLAFFNVAETEIAKMSGIFQISLVIPFLMVFSLALEQLMFITNKSREYIRITLGVTVINVTLILVLLQNFKLWGVVISIVISEIVFIALYLKRTLYFQRAIAEVSSDEKTILTVSNEN